MYRETESWLSVDVLAPVHAREGSRRANYPIPPREGSDETYRFREVGHGMVASRAATGKLPETLLPPLKAWETESLSGMGRSSGIALSGERARVRGLR